MGIVAELNRRDSINMCGIAGFFAPRGGCPMDIQEAAGRMIRHLKHRGPNDEGVWCESSSGLSLAHRRLSILDISEAGHQPMVSHCGRYVMVFNGEIYNHLAIRLELESAAGSKSWRGHSDTETLLTAIAVWGIEFTLKNIVGMFAFAIWDRKEKTLYFARDRLGEKPLYYGLNKGALLFASELKALRAYPGFQAEVDRNALSLFLQRNMIPAPHSIYSGIFKLPPGTWYKVTMEDIARGQLPNPKSYWSISEVVANGQSNLFQGNKAEASFELERLLKQSIKGQMLADVPLGAFLSGGVDSTTIVALMQSQSVKPIQTFTIGFNEANYNEATHAQEVASYIGTQHTELIMTSEQALAVIPRLPVIYDEPFADVSQIPTFLVSQLARRDVAVCLSGDGGDELFGGYNRYVSGSRFWRRLSWVPERLRRCMAEAIIAVPPSVWDTWFERYAELLPSAGRVKTVGDKLHKVSNMLFATSAEDVYSRLVLQWLNAEQIVIGATLLRDQKQACLLKELEHQMMYMDFATYLPDDILVKVDRAAMASSLETRIPMLDHRLVEFAWKLPLDMKIRGNQGKWLLRDLLYRYVPRALIERPKLGFGVPIDSWLRGALRPWAEELLDPRTLKSQGYLNSEPIALKWQEHLSGKRNWATQLWGVLMFQAWLHENHNP